MAIGIVAGVCWVPVLGLVFLAISVVDASVIGTPSRLAASTFVAVYLWAMAAFASIIAAPIGLLWAVATRWVGGARAPASVVP